MVCIPISCAISATTGIAPVPVPPPIPAVKNNNCVPANTCLMSSLLSMAAFSPTSGFAPAPRPFVVSFPICKTLSIFVLFNMASSVLKK